MNIKGKQWKYDGSVEWKTNQDELESDKDGGKSNEIEWKSDELELKSDKNGWKFEWKYNGFERKSLDIYWLLFLHT